MRKDWKTQVPLDFRFLVLIGSILLSVERLQELNISSFCLRG
jgi:hypothetical protein